MDINNRNLRWDYGEAGSVSILELKRNFEFKVCDVKVNSSIMSLTPEAKNTSTSLSVEAGLYHGGTLIGALVETPAKPCTPSTPTVFNHWMRFNCPVNQIPEVSTLSPYCMLSPLGCRCSCLVWVCKMRACSVMAPSSGMDVNQFRKQECA